jgi:hypothetical protein
MLAESKYAASPLESTAIHGRSVLDDRLGAPDVEEFGRAFSSWCRGVLSGVVDYFADLRDDAGF